ncbi:hypothetical protein PMAYCL1PPCAC_22400, partial [Pristionchus mayeri]
FMLKKNVKPVDKSFVCPKCDMKLLSQTNLNRHMKTHSNSRRYKCSSCEESFRNSSDRNRHVYRVHHMQVICSPSATSRPVDQVNPMGLTISSNGEVYFPCHYCDRKCPSNGARSSHIRHIHKMQPYACRTCGLDFYGRAGLRDHLLKNKKHQALGLDTMSAKD